MRMISSSSRSISMESSSLVTAAFNLPNLIDRESESSRRLFYERCQWDLGMIYTGFGEFGDEMIRYLALSSRGADVDEVLVLLFGMRCGSWWPEASRWRCRVLVARIYWSWDR